MTTTTQATRMSRARIVRRARTAAPECVAQRIRVAAEVAALLVITLLLVALPLLSRQTQSTAPVATSEVITRPGDTLWSVAQSNPYPGMTTAETVDYIAKMNGMESSRIRVGSSILVPVEDGQLELACK